MIQFCIPPEKRRLKEHVKLSFIHAGIPFLPEYSTEFHSSIQETSTIEAIPQIFAYLHLRGTVSIDNPRCWYSKIMQNLYPGPLSWPHLNGQILPVQPVATTRVSQQPATVMPGTCRVACRQFAGMSPRTAVPWMVDRGVSINGGAQNGANFGILRMNWMNGWFYLWTWTILSYHLKTNMHDFGFGIDD